jgi:hypothetical protein
MSEDSCCICGTIKNCEKYIDNVFINIDNIIKIFKDYHIIIYYDESNDKTFEKIKAYQKKYKIKLHYNKIFVSQFRTHRLAYGRNYCVKKIKKHLSHFKYFIMMDFDDVCSGKMNVDVLKKHIDNNDRWDSLSFNRSNYYDIWALSIRPFIFSYVHFKNPYDILHNMGLYICKSLNSLKEGELLSCYSAFNGFAIYKTEVFKDCTYDGNIRLDLIPKNLLEETIKENKSKIIFKSQSWLSILNEDCEHRSFHFDAINKKNARIFIAPEKLF